MFDVTGVKNFRVRCKQSLVSLAFLSQCHAKLGGHTHTNRSTVLSSFHILSLPLFLIRLVGRQLTPVPVFAPTR